MVKAVGPLYSNMIRTILKQRHSQGAQITADFLTSIWPQIIGEEIAGVTWPMALDDKGRLTIATATETWRKQLTPQRRRMLEILNGLLPEPIKKIELTLAEPHMRAETGRGSRPQEPELGSLPMAEMRLLEDIEDEELRALLTRVRRRDRGSRDEGQ